MKEISLGWHGKNKGKYQALVDDADYEWLSQWSWRAVRRRRTFYAMCHYKMPDGTDRGVYMHRLILGLEIGDPRQGDHINHNGLDNRRDNVRIVTPQENNFNRDDAKGYSWSKQHKKFEAYIQVNGVKMNLGLFDEAIIARSAHLAAKKKYHKIAS